MAWGGAAGPGETVGQCRVLRSRYDRLAAIVEHPHELLAYERWLDAERDRAQHGRAQRHEDGARDYLFSRERPRFEPRKDDVVVALPGLSANKRGAGCRLVGEGVDLTIKSLAVGPAQAVIDAMDGTRRLLEVRWAAQVDAGLMSRFLRATFGLVVFAPRAVADLEGKLSGSQLVRFPAAPYAIERPYWENMIAVRQHFAARIDAVEDPGRFVTLLRELHVVALMGERLDRFYKPASPIADRQVAPGALYEDSPRVIEGEAGPIYLDGPRVRVPLLGGEEYHRALADDVGDRDALAPERRFSSDGLDAGRVITARSQTDDEPVAMFLPPRPLTEAHFEVLRDALIEARDGDDVVGACARFHRTWVRLHPFHCANQSVAMNLVNAMLEQRRGAGIPHLVLDHLALRFSDEAYEELFRRAVAAYAVSEAEPARRLALLEERKRRSFAVIEALGGPTPSSPDEAKKADPDGARWALLDGPPQST